MIAANGVTARYLSSRSSSLPCGAWSARRSDGTGSSSLPGSTDSSSPTNRIQDRWNEFLVKEKAADPLRFPDLSLSVIKLMGPGEYVADFPGDAAPPGHFGLAVGDYTHSTAPNRRYPDIVTQRLLKAALAGQPAPYGKR